MKPDALRIPAAMVRLHAPPELAAALRTKEENPARSGEEGTR